MTLKLKSQRVSKASASTSVATDARDDRRVAKRVAALAQRLQSTQATLAVAESCTGGYLSKVLTDRPGSSEWFLGGWVVYSNAAKVRDGKVPQRVLEVDGAVSEATVRALARSVLKRFQSDWSIAISGVAGPSGGSPAKPVGSVWLAIGRRQARHHVVQTYWCQFRGNRDAVRRQSVAVALEQLEAWLAEG